MVICRSLEPGELPDLCSLGFSESTLARCQQDKAAMGAGLHGGETEALKQLQVYAGECKAKNNNTSSSSSASAGRPQLGKGGGGGGSNFSCKISPWLALGCLSPRQMYQHVLKEVQGGGGKGAGERGLNWGRRGRG